MNLQALTDRAEIKQAMETAWSNVTRGAQPYLRRIGWHGGHTEHMVYWNEELHMWTLLGWEPPNRHNFWFAFGQDDPHYAHVLGITCEINTPHEGVNRQFAGAFVRGTSGAIYLTHNGNLGGGRPGINKTAFLAYYRGDNQETVDYPGKEPMDVIVIGQIDDPHFPTQVAYFVQYVAEFKAAAIGRSFKEQSASVGPEFSPEFGGERQSYHIDKVIAARCDHGPVVGALRDELNKRKYKVANDQYKDLFVLSPNGQMEMLFEVKTDLSTSSIYVGTGQLMLHGAAQAKPPKRILVLPSIPQNSLLGALNSLEISVLRYEWQDEQPVFPNLDTVLH